MKIQRSKIINKKAGVRCKIAAGARLNFFVGLRAKHDEKMRMKSDVPQNYLMTVGNTRFS